MMVLSVIAVVLSFILTLHGLAMSDMVGCPAGSSCDMVTSSRWSVILGILPVSAFSLSMYLAVLMCCVFLYLQEDDFVKKLLGGLVTAVLFGSLWFIFIQTFKIRAFCPYCMSAHTCGILLALCTGLWLVRGEGMSMKDLRKPFLSGVALAVAFAVFQVATTPSYRMDEGRSPDPLPIPAAVAAPCIGSPDAPHTVALLYDYQCPHCNIIHDLLEDVVEELEGEVSFVLCPSPLSPACNPYIPAGHDSFPGSCTMAQLALSLWKHDPALFEVYDRWLWEEGRTEAECLEKARSLWAGADAGDVWVRQYLSGTLELFARTSAEGKGGIPRLVYGDSWVIPEVDDSKALADIVRQLLP